ncbi:MAG: 16S rRNA (uracil(1498)-N(3))-methyltransferase [Candidatus Hydrogenedentes bacterium]|nr:16S rRNA (uracil(1498)-N(3))-methyltransferase [Candidatus Hydrogenedentota bacterium]
MPHRYRFYIPPETATEAEVVLSAEESHHALRVARCRVGEVVTLFDGHGRELIGKVSDASEKACRVAVEEERIQPEPPVQVALVQACLNHEKVQDTLIARATELGVSRMIFFQGEHSEHPSRHRDKWARIAIESCKQCGRAWLPEFAEQKNLEDALAILSDYTLLVTALDSPASSLRDTLDGQRRVAIVVGPEGGLSDAEMEQASNAGAIPFSLGNATLRSELAATVATSIVLYELGALGESGNE